MTGMAAAQLMIEAGIGLLRTMPQPRRADIESCASSVGARHQLGSRTAYSDRIRTLDAN